MSGVTGFVGVGLLGLLFFPVRSSSEGPGQPLDIGGRRQVFIDERFFQNFKGLELTVHPPAKTHELP